MEGRALECLGRTRLTVTLETRAIEWNFIVAEIGDDEGILGNDFEMAHELTVGPCEGAVYLPTLSKEEEEHMGQHLPCTIQSVTEVRSITEETLTDRALGPGFPVKRGSEGTWARGVQAVTRNQRRELGWTPEEMAAGSVRRSGYQSHYAMEAVWERPAPLRRHIA